MSIVQGSSILAADYNQARNKLVSVITSYYGYTSPTPTNVVSTSSFITLDNWRRLWLDASRCYIHQKGVGIPGLAEPQVGSILTATFAQNLSSVVDQLVVDQDLVAVNQLSQQTNSDVRTNSWGLDETQISSEIDYQFADAANLGYWANLGGSISVSVSYPSGSYSGIDLAFKNLFDNINVQLATASYKKNTVSPLIISASSGSNSVQVSWTKVAANRVKVQIFCVVGGTPTVVNIVPTVNFIIKRSNNTAGPSPFGVPSPGIDIQPGVNFDQGGGQAPPSRILSVSPSSLSLSFPAFSSSNLQTISLTNIGNATVTVSSLELARAGNIGGQLIGGTLTIPGTIAPGETKTVELFYVSGSADQGLFNTTIKIISDNQQGIITIPVELTVLAPVFSISISPTSWVANVSDLTSVSQVFAIASSPGTGLDSYTAVLSNNHSGSITVDTSGANPKVSWNPNLVANGTYTSVLTVTGNFGTSSSVATANITLTRNVQVAVTRNLGTWISAAANANSICGMSYDVVNNVRYLTIGFGMGADGFNDVANGGYLDSELVNVLGIGSDLKPTAGPALFKSPFDNFYTGFLNSYGAWVRSESNLPHNVEQIRSYKISVVQAGNYTWTIAADNNCYFAIDGVIVTDRRTVEVDYGDGNIQTVSNNDAYTSDLSGQVYLGAGDHTLTFGVTNTGFPGAIGLRLSLAIPPYTELWSTLTPVRDQIPYPSWAEVYRIPLTQGAVTYNINDYVVKNGGYAGGYTYGSFMGSGALCSVTDDGVGNLSISFPTTAQVSNSTTRANTYLPWYYIQVTEVTRQTQLDTDVSSGSTRYFLGFDAEGNVLTTLVPVPISGGRGGYGGGPPIFFGGGGLLFVGGSLIGIGGRIPNQEEEEDPYIPTESE